MATPVMAAPMDVIHPTTIANELDEIYPNLYLGGITAAESAHILEAYAITDIISITSHRPRIPKHLNIRKKHFRLRDNTTSNLLSVLPEAVSLLETILSEDDGGIDEHGRIRRVLVHCRMGMSRSGGIVVAYAMKYAQIPAQLALEYVRTMRPIVQPNRAFMAQLTLWGECAYDVSFLEDPGKYVGGVEGEEGEVDMLNKAIEMSLGECSEGVVEGGGKKEDEDEDGDVVMGDEPLREDEQPSSMGELDELEDFPQRYDPKQELVSPIVGTQHPTYAPTNNHEVAGNSGVGISLQLLQPQLETLPIPTKDPQVNLHPERRQTAKGKDTHNEKEWAKVIMRDGMKRCFEECIRDVHERLGLRIDAVS